MAGVKRGAEGGGGEREETVGGLPTFSRPGCGGRIIKGREGVGEGFGGGDFLPYSLCFPFIPTLMVPLITLPSIPHFKIKDGDNKHVILVDTEQLLVVLFII